MLWIMKQLFLLLLLTLLTACGGGGGGGGTNYIVVFAGTVSGLPSGQRLTVLATLPTTGQSIPITISQNGAFSDQISLASGYNLTNYGIANVIISQQPSGAKCSVSFTTTSAISLKCSTVNGAAGLYFGSLTTPTYTDGVGQMFIKNNGNYWIMLGRTNAQTSATSYYGIISGTGASTETTFTSTDAVDIFSNPQYTNVATSATYQSLSTLIGSVIERSTVFSLNLSAVPAYSFNETPLLSNLSGIYKINLASTSPDTLNLFVDSKGSFNGTTVQGCAISGSATPMTTGENAYDLSVKFGPAPCAKPSTSQSGTVLLVTTKAGIQLVGGVFSAGLTDGTILVGNKQ